MVEPKLTTKFPTLCCIYLCSAWAWDGMQPHWLVRRVKRLLHLAWAVYCWSCRVFQEGRLHINHTWQPVIGF
jgi:hypothetical protein